jgi:hypothetical protein
MTMRRGCGLSPDGDRKRGPESPCYQLTAVKRHSSSVRATSGTLHPRLTLRGPQGQVLMHSHYGRISIHLSPGTYTLSVSAHAGVGAYELTTTFTPST